jgi:hypothetical protein
MINGFPNFPSVHGNEREPENIAGINSKRK